MWLHSFQHERVRELWRVIWAVQDQTVSRSRSPKRPIQLCSLHIVDFSWLSKPILHFGCWDGVRGSRAFFVCGKPLMPEWVNMEETFWMRFVDLNRCRRATKYCRLVRWSCRWMVGRKGSTIWRNLFSNLNKRENDTLKKATVVVHVCSLWAIKEIVSVDRKFRRDHFWLIVWVGNSNLSWAAQLFCLLQDLREKWV